MKFEGISTTRLQELTMRFDSYKMCSDHAIKKHLRAMLTIICELKTTGHNVIDEQQVQTVIRLLPNS